jgi:predicted GIY-YIG superfamily endonuclease
MWPDGQGQEYVYILARKRNGTLYVGVTSDLVKRVYAHKSDLVDGFAKKYGVRNLVYCETVDSIDSAMARETAEEVRQGLEGQVGREGEPRLERPAS